MLARHGGFWFAIKYFPTGSILGAKPKGRISYRWIVLKEVQLLKKPIWSVGHGNSINI